MRTIIKVYENDYDFHYENYILVDITKEEKEKLYEFIHEISELDVEDRINKYKEESSITLIENYIVKNLKTLDFDRINIDTYEI